MDGTRHPDPDGAQAAPLADAGELPAWGEARPVDAAAIALARAPQRQRVLVFRRDLLPLSETFVRQQAVGLHDWQAVLVGHRQVPDGLDLSGLVSYLVGDDAGGWLQELFWGAYRIAGWPVPAVLHAVRQANAALVHVHFGTDAVTAWPWLRHLGLPMVVTLHGYDINVDPGAWAGGHGGRSMRRYPERLQALAREPRVSFIAVSEAIRQRAITAYGIPAGKIKVLYIGVDNTTFTPGPTPIGARPPRVLFVGRLVEKKGLDALIRAMELVQRRVLAAELVVIGDGPLREASELMASCLGVNATFLGARPSAIVRQWLDDARVLSLPSVRAANGDAEGFGIVLLEAQASGVPVVTSAVGGRDEGVLDGVTGFAFDEGDHVALAGHLIKILTDDELATRMGNEAVRFVASWFSLADCNRSLERYYTRFAYRSER